MKNQFNSVLCSLILIVVTLFVSCDNDGNSLSNEKYIAQKDSLKELIRSEYKSLMVYRDNNPHMFDYDVRYLRNEIALSEEICQVIQVMLQDNRLSKDDINYVKGLISNLSKGFEKDKFFIDTIPNFQIPDFNKISPVKAKIFGKKSLRNNLKTIGIELFNTTLKVTKHYQIRLKKLSDLQKKRDELIAKGLLKPF